MQAVQVYLVIGEGNSLPAGGFGAVQLRDKSSDDAAYATNAKKLAQDCKGRGIPFLLNDRWHLVDETGADGVHLGQDDAPIEQVRRALGPGAIIGLSTHNRAEAEEAHERGADYIGLGPMFSTTTKDLTLPPGGSALFESVDGATGLPIFCIGGIHEHNLPSLIAAGVTQIAVSSAILSSPDPVAAAERLTAMLATTLPGKQSAGK
jgi:thiamine-phosphate pyrophosphorylase